MLVTLDVLIRQAVVSLVVTNVGPAIDGWLIAGCCCLRFKLATDNDKEIEKPAKIILEEDQYLLRRAENMVKSYL